MPLTPLPNNPISIRLPLTWSPKGAFTTNDTTLDAVKTNLATFLKTNWGERVMQYEFGANLRALLFQNDGNLEQEITDRITSGVDRWFPGVAILDITVTTDGPNLSPNSCLVNVSFGLVNTDLTADVSAVIK